MKTSAMTLVAGMCMGLLASGGAEAADRNQATTSRAPEVTVAAVPSAAAEAAAAPNCLLPGQIHSFGGVALLMPKRAVTLDPTACTERGGEPITAATAAN